MSGTNQHCAGIDVSKTTLDIAFSGVTNQSTMPNDLEGFTKVVSELKRNCMRLILMEATGGLESGATCYLQSKVLMLLSLIPDRREIFSRDGLSG